jgi:soluble lytic murein transglycosylase
MSRLLRPLLLALTLGALAAAGLYLWRSPDPWYTAKERLFHYGQYDPLILAAAQRYKVDPMLVKAIAWRESHFDPHMRGTSGERGLMQIMEAAGQDWAHSEKIETFAAPDLFDPKVNLEAGAWYLARAEEHWKHRDDPIPFTLAEYNAGRKRVNQWIAQAGPDPQVTAPQFLHTMNFPTTRRYIDDVLRRYHFYQQRGHL